MAIARQAEWPGPGRAVRHPSKMRRVCRDEVSDGSQEAFCVLTKHTFRNVETRLTGGGASGARCVLQKPLSYSGGLAAMNPTPSQGLGQTLALVSRDDPASKNNTRSGRRAGPPSRTRAKARAGALTLVPTGANSREMLETGFWRPLSKGRNAHGRLLRPGRGGAGTSDNKRQKPWHERCGRTGDGHGASAQPLRSSVAFFPIGSVIGRNAGAPDSSLLSSLLPPSIIPEIYRRELAQIGQCGRQIWHPMPSQQAVAPYHVMFQLRLLRRPRAAQKTKALRAT